MVRLALLLTAGLFQTGFGIRFDPGTIVYPTGPKLEPEGRHIQMIYYNHPHGLTDRIIKYIRPLIALGMYHNATVHMCGTPQTLLAYDHSVDVADSWGRYFDLTANDGNPWNEPQNFRGCKNVQGWEILNLFNDGSLCVNIISEIGPFDALPRQLKSLKPQVPVSEEIKAAAGRFLGTNGIPSEAYGSCHIRRCDYYLGTKGCTDPGVIFENINASRHMKDWLFFMYAEAGYRERLAETLQPLGLRLFFEDDAVFNDAYPQDNYFTYLLGKYLNGGAEVIVETHLCRGNVPKIFHSKKVDGHGIFLPRETRRGSGSDDDEDEDVEGAFFGDAEMAVCDDRERGAKLLKPRKRVPPKPKIPPP